MDEGLDGDEGEGVGLVGGTIDCAGTEGEDEGLGETPQAVSINVLIAMRESERKPCRECMI
ncbi:MAG: hypothetical protein A2V81_00365 [Candidatus Abawacabacteria bacterium RBG_16_42_10]|uniref:Uncharacterized protein n=1 Tax=Candidatus Abawacabacteria bacterium RBG_16_42_10 TaxID=1817814 RepID=A0A1F4XJC4_9BACT|nr:MAG: hypothetical protein A2V81_00365 [Candidatus Abawacabacteria bacterium RBG_16_42_10]